MLLAALALPPLATARPASAQAGSTPVEVAADPQVLRAQAEQQAAQRQRAELAAQLDLLAAAYEEARAHHERVLGDVDASRSSVEVAAEAARTRREQLAERVAAAYMRPGAGLDLASALARSRDPGTAVHRAALLERLTARTAVLALRADDVQLSAADVLRQAEVIGVGTAITLAAEQARAEDLTDALEGANQAVAEADEAVAGAEQAATERIEERRRAEEEAAREAARQEAARQAAAREAAARAAAAREAADRQAAGLVPIVQPGLPTPDVGGKVCPIGAPNAFIDSWGFPRSGGRRHQGVDIFAEHGMPLYAVADGVIRRVWNNRLGGLSIDLVDDAGDRYYYAHLSAAYVTGGQRVRAGEVIGANGNTGNARTTPPHLHWQYHPGDGPPVNPYPLAARLCR